jgi:hypothetical protein
MSILFFPSFGFAAPLDDVYIACLYIETYTRATLLIFSPSPLLSLSVPS